RIARIDTDRMNAGGVIAATEPSLALGRVPQGPHQFPALAPVAGAKEPARKRPAPDEPRFRWPAGRQCPQLERGPGNGPSHGIDVVHALGLLGVGGSLTGLPRLAEPPGAMQFHPEMAMLERGKDMAIARVRQNGGYIVAQKIDAHDAPASASLRDGEEAL